MSTARSLAINKVSQLGRLIEELIRNEMFRRIDGEPCRNVWSVLDRILYSGDDEFLLTQEDNDTDAIHIITNHPNGTFVLVNKNMTKYISDLFQVLVKFDTDNILVPENLWLTPNQIQSV